MKVCESLTKLRPAQLQPFASREVYHKEIDKLALPFFFFSFFSETDPGDAALGLALVDSVGGVLGRGSTPPGLPEPSPEVLSLRRCSRFSLLLILVSQVPDTDRHGRLVGGS